MDNSEFAHLHLHTDASLRDGLGTVTRMLTKAKNMGFKQIAMTDHGTLANAVTFSVEAQAHGIKPLMGLEGYVEFDGAIGHITLLANGAAGWNSLLQLNNLAHESRFRQPAFTIDELIEHQFGLLCLTGCIASPFHQLSWRESKLLGYKLKGAFGSRLFAELMFVGDSLGWERPLKLAESLDLKRIITNDVHFPYVTDGAIHPVLTKMKSGFDYDSKELYLKSWKQIWNQAKRYDLDPDEVKDMLRRAGNIARLLKPVNLASEPKLPEIDKSIESLDYLVRTSSRVDFLDRMSYRSRYEYELTIIKEMKYDDYFIILNDIINMARTSGIKVGPGRGSGAGSLILFLLGITDVDPIEHGLQFERFLNPSRKGMPDVDVDIESERRDEVLRFANEKYGATPIATYSRYSHKSLTRDLGKMFRADKKLIAKAADKGASSDEFGELIKLDPRFEDCYLSFMGQIRHKGKHAGGVIITETPVPIERIGSGLGAAWTEGVKNELSYAGIVKFDLLGLSVLSALRRLEDWLGTTAPACYDNAPPFYIFRTGDLSGIFQFAGSDGIKQLTMKLSPTKFKDLVAINALYRPGAIDAGSMEAYPAWKKSPRKVHSYIADILEETYGAVVYQEQFMEIFARTVGGSIADADLARRIITKSKPDDPVWVEKLSLLRAQFVGAATDKWGLSFPEAGKLWSELATHTNYSFNKSHATAYAMIAWECAWWKFNYPTQFYAAMLNIDPQQEQTYIVDAVKSGLAIGPPHVNKSTDEWTGRGEVISMPLGAVKFLGAAGVNAIIEQRLASGKFVNVEDFMTKVPKKLVRARAREGLAQLGGFSGLFDREKTYEYLEEVLGLKDVPILKSKRERQLRYLGVIIPDAKLLAKFEKLESEGYICGIIKNRDSRESRYGPYMVYKLSPNGVFWSRDIMDLEKGQVVAVDVNESNGKAKEIKLL